MEASYRIFRISHRVKRTELHWELIDNEIVGVVLGLDNPAKSLLVLRARIEGWSDEALLTEK
jgi:hypothetical protein